jgi:hypothetical protein
VLEKLAALPISTWNYKGDDPAVRHMGPMAQDFAAAFGLGADDRTINLLDANGVVMVSIQALYRRLEQLEAEISELRSAVAEADSATPRKRGAKDPAAAARSRQSGRKR